MNGPGIATLSCRLGNPTGNGIHNKMVLVQAGGTGHVHLGSINGSENASKNNRETALQVQSPDACLFLAEVFNSDRAAAGGGSADTTPPAAPRNLAAAASGLLRVAALAIGVWCAWATGAQARATAVRVDLSTASVRQGEVIEVAIAADRRPAVRFAGRSWQVYRDGDLWRTYLGTDPRTPPGRHLVQVATGAQVTARAVEVRRGAFAVRRLALDPDKVALLDPRLAAVERRRVAAALAVLHPARLWRRPFALPVQGRLTSAYGVLSVYAGRVRGFHRGVDLAAPPGTPVRASADGIVRLAEMLPLSGHAVLVDHGLGVVSSYLHLSGLAVRTGQRISSGALVGWVGSTGLATGPHLHWGLRTNGVHVDPLPWTRPPR